MSTLIDALKGLLSRMEVDPFQAPCHEQSLREIIAEHERSGTDERTRIEHERGAQPLPKGPA